MIKLKPCPFCGGTDIMIKDEENWSYIWCGDCLMASWQREACSVEDNVEAWNKRTLKEQKAEGKWIYGEDETGVDGWHCSECNFFEPWFYEFTDDIDFIRFYGFCPSCGKKMTSYTGKPTQEGR